MWNGHIYVSGHSVLISDIGNQPRNRANPESTIVCVTTNVNTACCRKNDNNAFTNGSAGSVGEWYYPNNSLVPRANGNVVDLQRTGFTHHVRLARAVSGSTPPLGVYTCRVPEPSTGVLHNASITIYMGMS